MARRSSDGQSRRSTVNGRLFLYGSSDWASTVATSPAGTFFGFPPVNGSNDQSRPATAKHKVGRFDVMKLTPEVQLLATRLLSPRRPASARDATATTSPPRPVNLSPGSKRPALPRPSPTHRPATPRAAFGGGERGEAIDKLEEQLMRSSLSARPRGRLVSASARTTRRSGGSGMMAEEPSTSAIPLTERPSTSPQRRRAVSSAQRAEPPAVAATDESPMTAEVRQLCACLRSSAGTASATATATAAAAAASALTAATAAAADDSFELGFAQLRLAVAEDEACVQQLREALVEALVEATEHQALALAAASAQAERTRWRPTTRAALDAPSNGMFVPQELGLLYANVPALAVANRLGPRMGLACEAEGQVAWRAEFSRARRLPRLLEHADASLHYALGAVRHYALSGWLEHVTARVAAADEQHAQAEAAASTDADAEAADAELLATATRLKEETLGACERCRLLERRLPPLSDAARVQSGRHVREHLAVAVAMADPAAVPAEVKALDDARRERARVRTSERASF